MMKTKTYQDRHFRSIGCCFSKGQMEVHLGQTVLFIKKTINKQTNNKQKHQLLLFEDKWTRKNDDNCDAEDNMEYYNDENDDHEDNDDNNNHDNYYHNANNDNNCNNDNTTNNKTCTVAYLRAPLVSAVV